MIYQDIPAEFSYIADLDIFKEIDKKSLGYYFIVVMTGTLVEHNQWGKPLVNLYEIACQNGYLKGYNTDISYRGMSYDIRATLIKAGIKSTPAAFIKKDMTLAVLQKKVSSQ